ncbi:MAG: hypothetical protein IT370_11175 [Deltaproteobacteria bacterium]|nr:hypothetical protein [Deltaproteobacteria bacterium]
MSESPENTALAELLEAIADRRIRRKVQKLLQIGEEAVRALGELDAALYVREDGEEQLQIVSDAVLSHLRRLLDYLRMVAAPENPAPGESAAEAAPAAPVSAPTLARGAALGVIATRNRTDDEKWRALTSEMDTLHYGLSSELREYDRRFADALSNDRKEQALGDLNDATTALMDGVFAVMTTVYECFLGHAEPERMIPGHRDTLGKALAVRRAIAELRRTVRDLNQTIQDRASDPVLAQASYQRMVEAVVDFIKSEVFFYLRSDTRKEFDRLRELLASGNAKQNRNDCEGFDKYLDSLAFISQRVVLITHDNEIKTKVTAELDRALAYVNLLPELVCDVILEAFTKAERLLGLSDQIDDLVTRWHALDDNARADIDRAVPLARALCDLVRPPPQNSPPGSSDFF